MRALLVCLFVVFASPSYAADNDSDKAKEVVEAFLQGLKAKDIDTVMKTVDVPFLLHSSSTDSKPIEKRDELKEVLTKLLEKAEPEKVKAINVGKVYDMAGLVKYVKDSGTPEKEAARFIEQAEKLGGKNGRVVMLMAEGNEFAGVVVRFKDAKALIAGVPK